MFNAQNSGLPMAKWPAKFYVWQAKITMNCQMDKEKAGQIYQTGFVTFASPLTILLYLLFLSTNQSSP